MTIIYINILTSHIGRAEKNSIGDQGGSMNMKLRLKLTSVFYGLWMFIVDIRNQYYQGADFHQLIFIRSSYFNGAFHSHGGSSQKSCIFFMGFVKTIHSGVSQPGELETPMTDGNQR